MSRQFPRTVRGLALLAMLLAGLLSGCAQMATYNAAYITPPSTPEAAKLPGKAMIYTVKADDDQSWTGKPTSFTGGGTTLTIPLGLIAREIAATVFGDTFRDGAVESNVLPGAAGGYRVIVQPKVSAFSYAYNQLKNVGLAITPTVVLTLEVAVLDNAGQTLNQRRYDSGTVEIPAYFISGSPGEEIGKAAHKALFDLTVRAAQDLREWLRLRGDGPLSL